MTTQTLDLGTALDVTLNRAAARIRIRTLLRFGGRALCWSALPLAITVALSKLQWFDTPPPLLLAVIMCLAVVVAIIVVVTRPLTHVDVAKITERKTDLKERLSSAVEFRAQGMNGDRRFYSEEIADASRHAGAISLKNALPIRIPWELPVGVFCALLMFLAFYLPTLPRFWSTERQQEMAEVKHHGIEIEKLAKDAEKAAEQQKLAETKKAAAEARKLGEEMHKGKLTKKESLVALAKLTKHMEETQKRLAQPPAKKTLDEAHKDFQKALDNLSRKKEDEARKADEMKKDPISKIAKDIKKPDNKMEPKESEAMRQTKQAMKQMADALANQDDQQMQQAMQKMAQQIQKGEMSKEEMKQMQQALEQLAQSLKGTNQQDAAQQMEQLNQMMQDGNNMDSKNLQQMAAMMNRIGQQMGKGQSKGQLMDAKALADLAQLLKEGRLTMAMGKGMGGHGRGNGYYGMGGPSSAMKDPDKTSPRLIAIGKSNQPAGKGKQGSAAEFASYLAKSSSAAKHLPNGKIAGTRSENGNELQMSMTGDPQAARSNSPYYQVVQTSKKQAESTLSKENIPASLKKQVRDYFDSIKP